MKKEALFFLILLYFCPNWVWAQNIKSVSILGDSYSTFQGYVQPETNAVWYFDPPRHSIQTLLPYVRHGGICSSRTKAITSA